MNRKSSLLATLLMVAACAHGKAPSAERANIPAFMLGDFQDDYGGRHTVTSSDWHQRPANRFHIVHWDLTGQFLVAQNDSANAGDAGRWTRIDWLRLDSMPPYTWAFCFSAYNAPSRAAAVSASMARRDTPRTGCNGYPFTRMKRSLP